MPAKAYRYYSVEKFPQLEIGEKRKTRYQGTLLPDTVDEGPRTEITAVGLADFPEFHKYHVMHEMWQSVIGRYKNEAIRGYVEQKEFHIYYKPQSKIMFIDTTASTSRDMLKRIELSKIQLVANSSEIDLLELSEDLKGDISGGWFGDLRIADVSTIGLFGGSVGESEEWERLEKLGTLSAIDLRYERAGEVHVMKITVDRTVVLFAPFTEHDALKFLEEIQSSLDSYTL